MQSNLNSKRIIEFYKLQIDELRANPKSFIPRLKQRLGRFNNKNEYTHCEISTLAFKTE
jgi:hypothetical protein